MYIGVDYYPEHWPEDRWPTDARLMRDAGFNVARLAEFAWSKMEPAKGEYDFTWLDQAIEVLASENIQIVLGTPTATPPKWLIDEHPDILPVDSFGRPRGFGSRRHYCSNHPAYREYSRQIAAKMGERYGQNPHVIAWQIDNEFGCHDTARCYCTYCQSAFQMWLKQKYGTLDRLNAEWGTVFWSQTYHTWESIIVPKHTVCEAPGWARHAHNPGLMLDFYRFSSDSVVDYQQLQLDVLRQHTEKPITHNMMGHFDQIDYFDLAKNLDFACWDNYPIGAPDYRVVSMAHDLMRGLRQENFWVMEQQSGPSGWNTLSSTPKPGQLRLWTYQAAAHGAEAIVYFRWRACPFGTEEYWYGVLDHDGIPRRRYRELQKTAQEMQALSDWFTESTVTADTAIIKSYDNLWSHEFQPHSAGFSYNGLLMDYYNAVTACSLTADVTTIDQDLSRYTVVFAPAFNLMDPNIRQRLEDYAAAGGNLVLTFRTGTRHWNNSMSTDPLPGHVRALAGVEVEEFDALGAERQVQVSGTFGQGTASVWCDVLKADKAQVLAAYTSDFYAGAPAVTMNAFGEGTVYYVGCALDDRALASLVKQITQGSGLEPALPIEHAGVEVVEKRKANQRVLMVLNHNSSTVHIKLPDHYDELLSGDEAEGTLTLEAYGTAMLKI